jgi:glycosyltransferase involved in cell wall biosynthesis
MSPAVTIGLPFFNCERTLLRALRSVFAQTFGDWELILVDDGSTDRSAGLAAAVRDRRVRLVADGVNRGLVARLNQITALARSAYVCRMDGDDLAHPERVATQLAWVREHRGVDVVGTAAVAIDADDRPSRLRAIRESILRDPREVLRRGGLIHPSTMARVEWLRRYPYDPEFLRAEDHELWVRSFAGSTLHHLPQPLYFYRESGPVSLWNYRRSCATERRILRRYGPALIGRAATGSSIARSYLKETCYCAFAAAGQTARLVALRGTPLTAAQRAEAEQAISAVLRTRVPGID